jgi:hypothetical protein
MRPMKMLFLAALVCGVAQPAWAVTIPAIASVTVQCEIGGGTPPQTLTVQVTFAAPADQLRYEFKNTFSGQTTTYTPFGMVLQQKLPLPPGTYNLTIKPLNAPNPQAVWNHIVVPVSVPTNGKGTGCRFLSFDDKGATVAPKN